MSSGLKKQNYGTNCDGGIQKIEGKGKIGVPVILSSYIRWERKPLISLKSNKTMF